ncbi:hypothetical protein Glove_251g31 [Diversispora epigaea]|uniref:Uncharacterized protein n=1 Tax=Diversispora epigaea TaxID=1348612 RepID=A0A397IEN5_9GLOM|nr:hypothetical protein Glove_251g31 [Diversispora epigaea]
MIAGGIRVWEWWNLWDLSDSPYDSTLDTICFVNIPKDVPISYESECAFTISDWSKINIPNDYNNCISVLPPITSLLVVTFTVICGMVLLGLLFMRGYFLWMMGCGGAIGLLIISGLQSSYSTERRCVRFVGKLFKLSTTQIISHKSLIYLWLHRNDFTRLLVQLFTAHG